MCNNDELGVVAAAHKQEERRRTVRLHQDLMIVSRGPAHPGRVCIGSIRTNTIVGRVDVEVLDNNVVVTVQRGDTSHFGPVSLVVV